jgi:hypothetical protein
VGSYRWIPRILSYILIRKISLTSDWLSILSELISDLISFKTC